MSASPKILLFGTGGVGSIYATILLRASCSVTTICRSNFSAVSSRGITLKSAKWGTSTYQPTHVVSSVSDALVYGPYDFILVCSKAFPGTASKELGPAIALSKKTAIVLAQNGIGIEEEWRELYPENLLISGIVWLPTTQYEPGYVVHSYPLERFEVGAYPAKAGAEASARVEELVRLFTRGEATAIACEDVQRERWGKIAINASMNPICALTLCDDANLFRSGTGAMESVEGVQLEVGSVADTVGYKGVITVHGIKERMKMYTERLAGGGKEPSMQVDVRCNRPMEVEAILGNLVRIAEKVQVKVPLLRMLYALATARNLAIVQDERWKPLSMGDA